ncbi:MAG TPA: hypothetical protein PLB96_12410 [Syntrophales bacterium]|nr:hypothetical protein [Syntrophales bacterium]
MPFLQPVDHKEEKFVWLDETDLKVPIHQEIQETHPLPLPDGSPENRYGKGKNGHRNLMFLLFIIGNNSSEYPRMWTEREMLGAKRWVLTGGDGDENLEPGISPGKEDPCLNCQKSSPCGVSSPAS